MQNTDFFFDLKNRKKSKFYQLLHIFGYGAVKIGREYRFFYRGVGGIRFVSWITPDSATKIKMFIENAQINEKIKDEVLNWTMILVPKANEFFKQYPGNLLTDEERKILGV